MVVLNPDHAAVLAGAGYDRAEVASALCDVGRQPAGELARSTRLAGTGDDDDLLPLLPPTPTTSSCSSPAAAASTRW